MRCARFFWYPESDAVTDPPELMSFDPQTSQCACVFRSIPLAGNALTRVSGDLLQRYMAAIGRFPCERVVYPGERFFGTRILRVGYADVLPIPFRDYSSFHALGPANSTGGAGARGH